MAVTPHYDLGLFTPLGVGWREDATAGALLDADMMLIDAALYELSQSGGSVTSVNGQTGVVVLTAAEVGADASGAAAAAQSNAEAYANGLASNYDAAGAAARAQSTAEASAAGLYIPLSVLTTEGDMLYENASLGPTRLPIGASGYVMTVVGGLPAWTAGGGSAPSIPAISDFTWVNQGSSTATQVLANGPIMATLEDASGLEWRGLFKNVLGAAPYKVQAQLRGLSAGYSNSQNIGLYFYDGTQLMGFECLIQSGGVLPRVERINSVTSDNGTAATYGSQSQAQMFNPYLSPMWLQLRNDGTDLYFDYSLDGANFINLWSEAVGSFITPTQYGFGGFSDTSGGQPSVICDLLAWVETNNATL